MSIYNYLVKKPNNEILSMQTYQQQVMLIVNTASQCQFTYQYEDLQKLYTRYQDRGFTILAFPCNQFGEQNPEDSQTTATQCKLQYGVSYPVFDKVMVNGEKAHPLFHYLKHEISCKDMPRDNMQQQMLYAHIEENYPDYLLAPNIRWNFIKFLVNRQGHVVHRFEPDDSILDIEQAIESLL